MRIRPAMQSLVHSLLLLSLLLHLLPSAVATAQTVAENSPDVNSHTLYLPLISKEIGNQALPTIKSFSADPAAISPGCASTLRWTVNGATTVTLTALGAVSGNEVAVNPTTTTEYLLTASNGVGTVTAKVTVNVITQSPADPSTVAPPLGGATVNGMAEAVRFLYNGDHALQTCTQSSAIEPKRVAVLRGKVSNREGSPLAGVTISILHHPELGMTQSREDGMFDLAVNGGGLLTVQYSKNGYLAAQRNVTPAWQEYTVLPEVVLLPVDPKVTAVDLAAATPMQVVRGSVIQDADGTRQSTLLIPQGITATMLLPDGSQQPVSQMHVHITEYTVGERGAAAMPADLPPSSGYTYAEEFTMEEALAAGAKTTLFSQPLIHYVENFLDFPVGVHVPTGAYDTDTAHWIPSPDGRVIKVLAIHDGLADLDVEGKDQAASSETLALLGISEAERATLATLYTPGQSLWRSLIPHFTLPWDLNWPYGCPDENHDKKADCVPPDQIPPQDTPDCSNLQSGSIIGCESQTLGEVEEIVGTPFQLYYQSERVPGRGAANTLQIPLSVGITLPTITKRIDLQVQIDGRLFSQSFPTTTNQVAIFTWDGKDAYGRTPQGRRPVTVRIGYTYPVVRMGTRDAVAQSFAAYGNVPMSGSKARMELTLWQDWHSSIGSFNALGEGLGGWSLNVHHSYDPFSGVLYFGDGSKRTAGALSPVLATVAGGGSCGELDCGLSGPALSASISLHGGAAFGPDGSLYLAGSSEIAAGVKLYKVDPNGTLSLIAGTGEVGFGGDGGPALQATFTGISGIVVAPDGTIFLADTSNHRVRQIGNDGIITTVAGNGQHRFAGDGGPAIEAALFAPQGLALAADGSLYIADYGNNRIRRLDPSGMINTVAGNGVAGYCGDNGPALKGCMQGPRGIALGADGSLYFTTYSHRVRRVGPDGIITTYAGIGVAGYAGDGLTANQAKLLEPFGVALAKDGSLYILEGGNTFFRIRRVGSDGIISTVAGTGLRCHLAPTTCADGSPATQTSLDEPSSISVGPDGNLYVVEASRLRRLRQPLPEAAAGDYTLVSSDGTEVYIFNSAGLHLHTLDALTGALRYQFSYDAANRLTAVVDGDGNTTTIERDGSSNPTAIVSPFGQRTTLTVNGDGFLASLSNPANETVHFGYDSGGLLTSLTDARNNTHTFNYDTLGRLVKDSNPGGMVKTLVRSDIPTDTIVSVSTPLNRTTVYEALPLYGNGLQRVITWPDGSQSITLRSVDGSAVAHFGNGVTTSQISAADPRWGIQAPLLSRQVISMPSGVHSTLMLTRAVTLADADDPFSLTSSTDTLLINGRVATRSYQASTRTLVTTSPMGRQVRQTVDEKGRIVQLQVGDLLPVSFSYNGRGQLVTVTQGSGAESRSYQYSYNNQGFLQTLSDPLGKTISYSYDGAGRITSQTLPDGRIINFAYDANGNLTALTPPSRPAHNFAWAADDLAQSYTPPDVGSGNPQTEYGRTTDRELNAIARPDGKTIGINYDSAGRMLTIQSDQGALNIAYDPATGNLSSISAPGNLQLAYGFDGDLLSNESWSGALSGTVSRSYDNDFNVISLSVNGAAIAYQYDGDQLLTAAGALSLSHNPQNGLLAGSTLGGVTTAASYNGFAELTNESAAFNGSPLYVVQYTRDQVGRITQKSETIGGIATHYGYSYDAAGRLTTVSKDNAPFASYSYDNNDNRTNSNGTAASYDNQDRLSQFGNTHYSYTANGDLSGKTNGGQTTSYRYDALGNLVTVTLPSQVTISYGIDGQNRRVVKLVNGVRSQAFLYQDSLNPVAELDGNNNLVSRFVYGSRPNLPDYMIKGGVTYRILADHLGSPRLVVNVANGQIVQRLDYDAFGNVLLDTNPGFQPFGFAGGLYDRDTKLVRFGARDYDAETGRWTAKDPILFDGEDTNLYSYVFADPINVFDVNGQSGHSAAGSGNSFVDLTVWLYKTSPMAKAEKVGFIGFANVFAQAGATVGEICISPLRLFGVNLGELNNQTLWGKTQRAFNDAYREVLHIQPKTPEEEAREWFKEMEESNRKREQSSYYQQQAGGGAPSYTLYSPY